MKKLYLLFLLFVCIFTWSQSFKPATIIFSDNSKLNGEVSYNNPNNTPQEFIFRKSNADKSINYSIKNIREVDIPGFATFIKSEIKISRHSENLQNLDSYKEFKLLTEERMIEKIVDGYYNLYKFEDNQNTAFYYSQRNDFEIKPLLFKTYFLDVDGHEKLENNEYVNDLKKINCNNTNYLDVKYAENSLANYFQDINICNGDIIEKKTKKNFINEYKVVANYNVIKKDYSDLVQSSYTLGLEYEMHFMNLDNIGALSFGLNYNYIKSYNSKTAYNVYTANSNFNIPISLRYYPINSDKFKFYTSICVFNFSLNSFNYVYMENYKYTYTKQSELNFMLFSYLEAGLRYKEFEVFAKYYLDKNKKQWFQSSIGLKYNLPF